MATNNNVDGPLGTNGMQVVGVTSGNGVQIGPIFTPTGDPNSGQMLVGDGSTTVVFPVPSLYDYKVFEADSGESTGLALRDSITASNDNNRIFGYGNSVSNFTVPNDYVPGSGSSSTGTNLIAIPFNIYKSTTFTKIGMSVTTGAASSQIRLGIYNANNYGGAPGTLVLDAGTIDSSTTGDKTITISQTLYGKYHLVFIANIAAIVRTLGTVSPSDVNAWIGTGSITTTNSNSSYSISPSTYFSALPSSFSYPFTSAPSSLSNYLIYLQV